MKYLKRTLALLTALTAIYMTGCAGGQSSGLPDLVSSIDAVTESSEESPGVSADPASQTGDVKAVSSETLSKADLNTEWDDTAVTLKFSFAPTTVTSTAFVLTIEQNGKTQLTSNIKGDSGIMEQQLQFSAGEYYIRIKPSTWIGSVYTIEMK